MDSIFGVSWEDLGPEHIDAFLADSTEEPITWEAKGREQPRRDTVRKHACGFANRIGGFLIVGAEQDAEGSWSAPGVAFDVDEPALWLEEVIRALRPAPAGEAKAWPRADGRKLAVLRVQPVAQPPCMTPGGTIYERVSGQTVPVTDPAALNRLFGRGEAALELADKHAHQAAIHLMLRPPIGVTPEVVLSIGIAAVGQPDDAAFAPFRPSFYRRLVESAERDLQPNAVLSGVPGFRTHAIASTDQEALMVALEGRHAHWFAAATRNCAVGVAHSVPDVTNREEARGSLTTLLAECLPRAWRFAADRLRDLGGRDLAHLQVRLDPHHRVAESLLVGNDPLMNAVRDDVRDIEVHRVVAIDHPTDDDLASVVRDLRRGLGYLDLEPEEEPPGTPG